MPADEAAVDAISLGSRVRLVSRHAARLAVEGDLAVLYYYTLNPRVLNAQPEHDRAQHIDFSLDAAPCLEKLLLAYPKYVTVGKLPGDNDAQRLDVVQVTPHTYYGDTYYTIYLPPSCSHAYDPTPCRPWLRLASCSFERPRSRPLDTGPPRPTVTDSRSIKQGETTMRPPTPRDRPSLDDAAIDRDTSTETTAAHRGSKYDELDASSPLKRNGYY